MKRSTVSAFVLVAAIFAFPTDGQAPANFDAEVELLRIDLRGERSNVVLKNMSLSGTEPNAFWPLYEEYQGEAQKIWDERIELIKDYASVYPDVSEAQADNMITKSFDLDQKMDKLRKTYYGKFKAALSAKTAARFMQIDRRINNVMELQIANSIPLAK